MKVFILLFVVLANTPEGVMGKVDPVMFTNMAACQEQYSILEAKMKANPPPVGVVAKLVPCQEIEFEKASFGDPTQPAIKA